MDAQDKGLGHDILTIANRRTLLEKVFEKAVWTIRKFANDEDFLNNKPYATSIFEGNVLLNEGINELWTLVAGGAGTAYSNANAYLGVGDSATGENAAHTGLQAAVNKTWKAMDGGYPTYGSDQKITFKATFGSGDANYDWNEFTAVNGSDDTGENLNRKVSAEGTKTSGQTWELTLEITLT